MNIYLDIEGVLVDRYGNSANGVLDFLKYITTHHTVYWLTTHCRTGGNRAVEYLSYKLPAEALTYLEKIKPNDWQTYKTEAIDFSKEFKWFDNNLMEAEKQELLAHNKLESFVLIDLKDNPNQLGDLVRSEF